MQSQAKNKLPIIALVVLFLTPVIVAIVMNSNWVNYSPKSFKNRGDLIKPPIKITDNDNLKRFEGFWTLVYSHVGKCQQDCLKILDSLYRIRLTKGHKMNEVKLLLLHPDSDSVDIPKQYTSIEQQSYQQSDKLNEILAALSKQSFNHGNGLFILAPEGFLMMSYPQDFKPQDVIKDLGLLLRARKNNG
jgi:hypothetical protein